MAPFAADWGPVKRRNRACEQDDVWCCRFNSNDKSDLKSLPIFLSISFSLMCAAGLLANLSGGLKAPANGLIVAPSPDEIMTSLVGIPAVLALPVIFNLSRTVKVAYA